MSRLNGRKWYSTAKCRHAVIGWGRSGVAVAMLMPLFEAATNWMKRGIPIETLKIVAGSARSAGELRGAFGVLRREYEHYVNGRGLKKRMICSLAIRGRIKM